MKQVFYILTILLSLNSCSLPTSARLTASELVANQSVIFKDGYSVINSTGDSTDVALVAEQLDRDVTLTVFCANKKGQAKTIQPTQIRVFSVGFNNAYSECKVYSAGEYVALLQKQTQRTSLFLAVVGSLEETVASQPTTSTTTIKVKDADSYKSETYTVKSETSANPVAVQQVRNKNILEQQQLMSDAQQEQKSVKEALLNKHTLQVGENKVGQVMVRSQVAKCRFFKIIIPFGNEEHVFILKPDVVK